MKATLPSGVLTPLQECYIDIPELETKITMNILPDLSDSKSASYPDENAIGRSMPFKSYQNSENRTISWTAHFVVCKEGDQQQIIDWLRVIEACTYPMTQTTGGAPYAPPPICHLRCGDLLSDRGAPELCTVMKSYSVKFDTSVPWDVEGYIPYKLDVDMQFEVVYNQADLPGAEQIMIDGVGNPN
jgi:hypothetical protein